MKLYNLTSGTLTCPRLRVPSSEDKLNAVLVIPRLSHSPLLLQQMQTLLCCSSVKYLSTTFFFYMYVHEPCALFVKGFRD